MTRAALLPAGPDPWLIALWLRHYAALWADEVDELRLIVCGQKDPGILAYLRALVASLPHATMTDLPERTDHGHVIGQLVEDAQANLLTLCEDDAYIRRSGVIDGAFRRIEHDETDIVGCPRGSASRELVVAMRERFGEPPSTATGESGAALWPCFLFARRADLLRTDGQFGARSWQPGEVVAGLDLVAQEPLSADTFGSTSYQLHALGLRIEWRPNYRVQASALAQWLDAPWFHVGSLSTGYGSSFLAEVPEVEYLRRLEVVSADAQEWCKRISWWRRAWRSWDGALPDFHARYGEAVDRLIADAGLPREQIEWWDRAFEPMVTW